MIENKRLDIEWVKDQFKFRLSTEYIGSDYFGMPLESFGCETRERLEKYYE